MPSQANPHDSTADGVSFAVAEQAVNERVCRITAEGELDMATAPALKRQLEAAVQEGKRRLVIDLTRVTFMDSTALGVLVGAQRTLREDGRLALVCTNPKVLLIFEISGLDDALAIFDSVEAAEAHVVEG